MRGLGGLVLACAVASYGCGDDANTDENGADNVVAGQGGGPADHAGHGGAAGAASDSGSASAAQTAAWAAEWIAAYDRQIAATCPCLIGVGAFPTTGDCIAALGSGPTWLECATTAVQEAEANALLNEADARCLIDGTVERAQCFEQAACEPEAMSACLSMPNQPAECAPVDTELVNLLLEKCPDLGLLSRVP
jgi:hypothetical protein